MKKSKRFSALFLVVALCLSLCVTVGAADDNITISNPYKNIDWDTVNTYKAALHSHTNGSDGDHTLLQSIERHAETGFDIVAVTDHGTVDYGWTKDNTNVVHSMLKLFGRTEGDIVTLSKSGTFPNGMTYSYYTAENGDDYLSLDGERTILRVPYGIENNAVSVNAHVNSWFVDHCNNTVTTYVDAVRGVDFLGGVSVINHPGEYTKARYELHSEDAYNENNFTYRYYINKFSRLLEKYPSCIGIDINSKGDGRTRFDRVLWDKLLTRFSAKGDTVLAIGSSDAHQLDKIDTGYSLLLMPSLDSASARAALKNGEFFAASHCIGNYEELCEIAAALKEFFGEEDELYLSVNEASLELLDRIEGIENGKYDADSSIGAVYSVLDEDGYCTAKTEPRVSSVAVDDEENVISIETENAAIVRLISGGKLIDTKKATDASFDLDDYTDFLGDYVRIEIFGEGGIVYTQAFLLNAESKDSSASVVDRGFLDVGFLDFLFAEIHKLNAVIERKLSNI